MTNEIQLCKILARLIKDRCMTITGLSRVSGVPVQTLHGWLYGAKPKDLCQIKRVAECFKVDLDYLCFGEESSSTILKDYQNEINVGIFEVILRKAK